MRHFLIRLDDVMVAHVAKLLADDVAANPATYASETDSLGYLPACFHSLLNPIDDVPNDEPMLNDFCA